MTALVTGGAGFVGTNVADRLLSRGERVRILDDLSRAGAEENLVWLDEKHGNLLEFERGSVCDGAAVRRATRDVQAVFHFAAQVAVTTSLDDPWDDFRVNAEGTVRVLEALRGSPVPLLFTSTNKVYGALEDIDVPVNESQPLDFCTPYGCSKGAADQYVLDYAKSFGVPATVFRMSCIYGPHQHGNEDQGWVAHFLLRALRDEPITIYGDGTQVRDILYVDDLVAAMLGALGRGGEVFNVGGGPANRISLLELLDLIGELHGRRPPVSFAPVRQGDQRWYVSDTRKLERDTGWRPRVSAREGIAMLYGWLAEERLRIAA